MCLIIKSLKDGGVYYTKDYGTSPKKLKRIGNSSIQIADKDITVYKVLRLQSDGRYKSPYYEYLYDVGDEIYQVEGKPKFKFSQSQWDKAIRVTVGLHAFTSERQAKTVRAELNYGRDNKNAKLCEFVIPKGSQYILGTSKDIVCDRYIFVKQL